MTTDAWKALKRERRHRVCRGIRRAVYWTAGSVLAVFLVGYATWFRFGWTDLPLRCVDWRWGEVRQISGELRPEAADTLEVWLTTLYGNGAVNRIAPGRLRIRPVVVYFGDNDRLKDLTIRLTDWFSDLNDYPSSGPETVDDCRVVQHYLMAGGQAEGCDDSWVQFFLAVIDQDDWPAMTHFFRVNQPSLGQMYNLPPEPPAPSLTDPHGGAAPTGLAELGCGPTMGNKFFYGSILIAGSVIWFFKSLWPF